MGFTLQCFSVEELEKLDPAQREILKHAIEREIGNNPDVQKVLRQKVQPTYDRMAKPTTE